MNQSVFEEHYEAVYKYILYLTNDSQLSHDLLQETFYRFYKQSMLIDNPKAFLIRIARNIVYDYFRKKRILKFFSLTKDDRIDEAPLPSEVLEKGEENAQLYHALQQLKMSYKEVVILRYIEEYSVKETAKILGQSETQVKNNTARGLQKLRELMEGGGRNASRKAEISPITRNK